MNKIFGLAFLTVVILAGLGGYWYMNPHQRPAFIRDNVPGFEVVAPNSPMKNFKPPSF